MVDPNLFGKKLVEGFTEALEIKLHAMQNEFHVNTKGVLDAIPKKMRNKIFWLIVRAIASKHLDKIK